MFNAKLISLGNGQSYPNVQICEDEDLIKYGIPPIFENWTGCFFVDEKCIVVHYWKIKVIKLYSDRRGTGKIKTERLVLDGDVSYGPATLISPSTWEAAGIPEFFIKRNGIAGQFAWSCSQGTYITHDTNVASIILQNPKSKGITTAIQLGRNHKTPKQIKKEANLPDTVHGTVTRESN